MQILVVFQKSDRKVIATFELNTIVTEMNVLVTPGISYLMTGKKDIFYTAKDGQVYVKKIWFTFQKKSYAEHIGNGWLL